MRHLHPLFIACFALILMLTAAGAAHADVLLFGWNGNNDGWTGSTIVSTSPPGGRGITEGSGALYFAGPVNSNIPLVSATDTSTILAALAGHTQLSFDAIKFYDDGVGWHTWSFNLFVGGTDSLGNSFDAQATFVDATGTFVTSGNPTNRVNGNQAHLIYDYSSIANGDLAAGTAQSVYFYFGSYPGGGLKTGEYPDDDKLVVDNFAVVVPEPASLVLLAAGGLMLIRRR